MSFSPTHQKDYRICFLGGARYAQPLSSTHQKKFALLKNLGDIHVVGFSLNWQPQYFQEEAHFYLLPNFPLPILRYMLFFTITPGILLGLILRHRVNIIIAQSPYEALAALWIKNLVKLWSYPLHLVVESHGDFENYLFLQRQVFLPLIYKSMMQSVAHITLSQADVLRSISQATQTQLKQYSCGQPIVEFMAWTDVSVFWQAGSTNESKQLTVIYVGVLIPRKGVHHLINAFAQAVKSVPAGQLKIIGRPENRDYAQTLKAQVDQCNLQDKILFLPEMPQQELAYEMAQSTVLVLPSLSEGLGRVLVEAMATGTPVIGTKVGGIPDIIQEGLTGFLVPPEDEHILAQKIIYLLEHPEKVSAMGQRGREFVQTYFSPEIYYQGYEKICQICLQST
ncbi:MAG: glycosyltransferase [Gloeomargarita sp. DG02_4_bins_56]